MKDGGGFSCKIAPRWLSPLKLTWNVTAPQWHPILTLSDFHFDTKWGRRSPKMQLRWAFPKILAPENPNIWRRVPVTTIQKVLAGAIHSKKTLNLVVPGSNFVWALYHVSSTCHQLNRIKKRALTINSDNGLQSADSFENLPEWPNVKCIRRR